MVAPTDVKTEILLELARRCEQATGPNRRLDLMIAQLSFHKNPVPPGSALEGEIAWRGGLGMKVRKFTASIDDALALVPKGWGIAACSTNGAGCGEVRLGVFGQQVTVYAWGCGLALALCATALKARAAQGTEAQRATTVEQGVVHDGPVAKPCAQTPGGGGK